MSSNSGTRGARVLYIPHGGGPLPLLGDSGHREMVEALPLLAREVGRPSAIVVVSAHWEAPNVTVTSGERPGLLYDYYGFPDEAYEIQYPAPGSPELARRIVSSLKEAGVAAREDEDRGFDHGLFVPLALMYPEADIPCVQVSLVKGLDPDLHIRLGEALGALAREDILILGSGFSFHNMREFSFGGGDEKDPKNDAFQAWLQETLGAEDISEADRRARLAAWERGPHARYCHPREEHLLPLQVCYGMTGRVADSIRIVRILGKAAVAVLWESV